MARIEMPSLTILNSQESFFSSAKGLGGLGISPDNQLLEDVNERMKGTNLVEESLS